MRSGRQCLLQQSGVFGAVDFDGAAGAGLVAGTAKCFKAAAENGVAGFSFIHLHATIRLSVKESFGGGMQGGTLNCPGFPCKQKIVSRNMPPAARRA